MTQLEAIGMIPWQEGLPAIESTSKNNCFAGGRLEEGASKLSAWKDWSPNCSVWMFLSQPENSAQARHVSPNTPHHSNRLQLRPPEYGLF